MYGYDQIGPESDIVIDTEWLVDSIDPLYFLAKYAYVHKLTDERTLVFIQIGVRTIRIRGVLEFRDNDLAHLFAEDFVEHFVPTEEFINAGNY